MRIGGRDVRRILRAPLSRGHWRALAGMPGVYPAGQLPETTRRFLIRGGAYPYTCAIRTPVGPVRIQLDCADDLLTVNEIFARRDYEAPADLRCAVDVGANIGIASLYFLTRNGIARSFLIEPDPKNVARIDRTLAGFVGRYEVMPVAAADRDGEATFFVEPTGRYGGFRQGWKSESITVPTRAFNDILGEVLGREGRIDVLKVDTEGSEPDLVGLIAPEHLDRIDRIYYETDDPMPFHEASYHHHFDCQTNALVRRDLLG